jgi:hypothetical protein
VTLRLTWRQALAWRMERQLLDPVGSPSISEVVGRLCAVQSQVPSSAELAVRVRRATSKPGEVAEALADGRLVRTWAMRGALHLLRAEEAGAYLSVIAATRPWEKPAWERWAGLTPQVLARYRAAARDALGSRALTRDELAVALTGRRGLGQVTARLAESWGAILKPLAWLGELCLGPSRDGRPTFMRPEAASSRWRPPPDPEEATPLVVASYFAAYGPAPKAAFAGWMGDGWFGKRPLLAAVASLGDRLVPVEVDGETAYALAEDLDSLAAARPSSAVRLLPGFDQYVLGPGTGDGHVVPPARRRAVSRQSGWIAPVVLDGGSVAGTWELKEAALHVTWFSESGRVPRGALAAEVERLGAIIGRDLRVTLTRA